MTILLVYFIIRWLCWTIYDHTYTSTLPASSVNTSLNYWKLGKTGIMNSFMYVFKRLGLNVSLYFKTLITRLVFFFEVSQERALMAFSCHVSSWFKYQVFYWVLKVPFKCNAISFLYLCPTTLWYESRDNIFNWIPFLMSISEIFVINGYLRNIIGVRFNRISNWFHNI